MTDSEKLDILLQKMETMNTKLDTIDQEVSNINFIIENEIRVNLQRIAEKNLDRTRNLYDTIKLSSELEVLAVMVTMHDTEIRIIKQKISQSKKLNDNISSKFAK